MFVLEAALERSNVCLRRPLCAVPAGSSTVLTAEGGSRET